MSNHFEPSGDWPAAELTNVQRMRVLSEVIPNVQLAESIVDAPFSRVWSWFSDLEHSVPRFDGQVKRMRVRRREGDHLRVTAWQGPRGVVPIPFDVLLEPTGWCLMTSRARLYFVGMCADPVGPDQTHVAILEGMPRRGGGLLASTVRHHVRGDIRRIARAMDSRNGN